MTSFLTRALLSGTAISVVTAAALGMLARQEGKDPIQPVNSTSHWLHGEKAGRSRAVDASHTGVGFATHHAASVLWASIFEAVRRIWPGRPPLVDAAGVTALAAVVDYGLVPKRITPGWEEVVSPRAIALAYGAMALTLYAMASRR